MTKLRPPVTAELALTKVAALIGWEDVSRIAGQAERTVRNWSDPDTTAAISVEAAIRLDIAHQAAGGDGFPFFTYIATRLDLEAEASFADSNTLVRAVATATRETGEANAAALDASLPGAEQADLIVAEREIEESIAAMTHTLATVRTMRTGRGAAPGGNP